MKASDIVFKSLDDLGIKYKLIKHPPAITTEDADKYIEGHSGVRTKTLFLRNRKKKKFYLIIMDDNKKVNIKKLEAILEDKGLGFCSDDLLMKKLGLEPGIVSIFGLINNREKDVKVIIDEEIINEEIFTFHPNVNIMTIFINKDDMLSYIEKQGYIYNIINIPS